MKEKILEVLKTVKRLEIESLITFLEESDFFKAPASTKYHGNFEGGLAEHSWNVYQIFKRKVQGYKLDIPEDSIVIAGLLHDICKVNFYTKETKWRKDCNGRWESYEDYGVCDSFPVGHGEKSVMMLQKFINLTDTEIMLIRWHMGGFESEDNRMHLYNALELCPAIAALHTADMEATYLLERKEVAE